MDAEGKPNMCDTCCGEFESVKLYKEHKVSCNKAKPVIPSAMDDVEVGSVENELATFMKDEKPCICDTCYLVLESEDLCEKHRPTCNKERPVLQMEVDGSLEVRIKEGKQYQCSVCQLLFTSEELWRNHCENCSEKKPFVYKEEHKTLETYGL